MASLKLKKFTSFIIAFFILCTISTVPTVNAYVVDENVLVAREVANEGIVLLENRNNALPLVDGNNSTPERVAIFGEGQTFCGVDEHGRAVTDKGFQISGYSSSGSNPIIENVIDPYEGLKRLSDEGRISLYDALSQKYIENPAYIPDDAMMESVADNADTAIVTVTRFPNTAIILPTEDWYLKDSEKTILQKLTEYKKAGRINKIIVVLNITSSIDTSWLEADNADNIDVDALISASYPGEQGGNSLADILIGDVNPSAKLCDTYIKSLSDMPNDLTGSIDEPYVEDIFVGYRYFETFGVDVRYPFGYGLSYTDFEYSNTTYSEANGKITVTVDVKNTGSRAGKEAVQCYYSAPQIGENGAKLYKASIELAAFEKTKLLQPGETETVSLSYDINDMASYDDENDTGHKSAYVLEAGDYDVYIGKNVKEAQTRKVGTYTVDSLVVTEQLKQYLTPQRTFDRIVAENDGGIIKKAFKAAKTGTPDEVEDMPYTPYDGPAREDIISFKEVLTKKVSIEQFVSQLSIEELANLSVGQPTTSAMNGVYGGKASIGAGKEINEKYDIPAADTFNASCGIVIGTCSTAWGSQVLSASTWNKELLYKLGLGMGKEAVKSGADILLANGVDIHRHPLNGGFVIYFSEDPILSAEMCAAETRGAQDAGVTMTIKTLALYSKRVPKAHDSLVTERAAREIHLKGFEKTFKSLVGNGKPLAIMASYNSINGTLATERKDLMTGITRQEWGFDGVIITDWGTSASNTYPGILAGSNVRVPTGNTYKDQRDSYIADIIDAVNTGKLTRNQLEYNTIQILNVLAQLPDAWIDLAPTSKILPSSCYAANSTMPQTVNNLFDGSKESDWAAREDKGSKLTRPRLVVDLNEEYPIKMVEIVPARATSFRKPFSIYLANEGDFSDKLLLYHSETGGNMYETTKLVVSELIDYEYAFKNYKYVMVEGEPGTNFGLAELKVFVAGNDIQELKDNSVLNISDLTPKTRMFATNGYSGKLPTLTCDMENSTTFITAQGAYNKEQYMFFEFEAPKAVDVITLVMSTDTGKGSGVSDTDLRTDFQIVARNDNNFKSTDGETVLIDYKDTLAKNNGSTSDLCVFEIPEEYKTSKFKYIGIRKSPSANNNNVGQLSISSFNIYQNVEYGKSEFDTPTASFDSATSTVSVSTVARTLENNNYNILIAAYDEQGILTEVNRITLKKPKESLRSENGSEIQGIAYASNITKTYTLLNPSKVKTVKVILLSDMLEAKPLAQFSNLNIE